MNFDALVCRISRTIEESRIENCYGMRMQEEDLRMQWAENLYPSDKTAKKKDKIMEKGQPWSRNGQYLLHHPGLQPGENLCDSFHAAHLKQPAFYKQDLYVVGIASGYEEALELVQRMIDDIYRKDRAALPCGNTFGRTEN